ncbi:outer membrane protein/peptidoglycan-associated (lipo)protein [Bernardetia litoralis DSM 6794]|uniref:Outer membrane protein/peptidoglycan-associated (Lipo)protein n=1 Tax=Bernardetia litoralis (strain ATCC 23117 / DSM 6794 / NBRC 15988 / NCIMB 1366 / Fx l1 / Sio-4) TaxID=880071 RepID=I4AHR1_BERLS|nr:OmpA family protein [Bernardetia litoralis]AFM03496.1 outer membrane protein/peptidoglycan-associated (lipo)protein [Bernardetia litoralis DSM 6794]
MQKFSVFIFYWCFFLISSFGESGKMMAQNSFKSQYLSFEHIDTTKKIEFILDKTLRGHSAGVQNIRFSPDGKWIASASLDRSIIIWDVKTGILRHRLRSHSASVYEVTFNKKGNLLASASEDGTVCLWDARYGKLLETYKNKPLSLTNGLILRSVSFVVFSPDNKYLYFGGDNGYIMRVRIDIPNQIPMQVFSINAEEDLLSNTITGGTIASTEKELIFSVDHYVYAISLQNHKLIRRFHYSKSDINDIVIGATKNQITGWGFDGNLVIWDYFSSKKINTFRVSPNENYSAASYSKNGNWVATGANGNSAKIWDTQTNKNVAILSKHKKVVRVCRFSPTENDKLATASYDGRVYIWRKKNKEDEIKEQAEKEKIALQSEIKVQNKNQKVQNSQQSSGACDTVFIDRIVEKIVEKPIYIETKNNDKLASINSESTEVIKEKIIYIHDTVYIRDTVYQKMLVNSDVQEEAKRSINSKSNFKNQSNTKENIVEELVENNEEIITIKEQKESEFDKQFEVGTTLNLHNVQFKQGTSKLLPKAYPDLEQLLAILKKYPKMKISLAGHTDNIGLHTVNLRLSGERVRTVQNYLVSKGISRSRIQTRAHGGKYPIASNTDEATRKLNRRVEITILSK